MIEFMKKYAMDGHLDVPGFLVWGTCVLVLVVLARWHVDESRFDLRRVLIDKKSGLVSLSKLGQFIALVVSTVVLWYEMMHNRLTEWLFVAYMVSWSGANLASRWIDTKNNPATTRPPFYSGPDRRGQSPADPAGYDGPERRRPEAAGDGSAHEKGVARGGQSFLDAPPPPQDPNEPRR